MASKKSWAMTPADYGTASKIASSMGLSQTQFFHRLLVAVGKGQSIGSNIVQASMAEEDNELISALDEINRKYGGIRPGTYKVSGRVGSLSIERRE